MPFMIEEWLGGAVAPAAPNLLDPSQVPDASAVYATVPSRPVDGEPGGRVRVTSAPALASSPTVYLVGCLALGIALFAYGTDRL